MASSGQVIGGSYVDSTVSVATFGSGVVIQTGFRGRKLDGETVAQWEEVPLESRRAKTVSAVGQAVAEAVLPRFLSKGASAAIGASIDSSSRPPRGVRVLWADGKQPSLLKLPEDLFTHFELVLGDRRAAPTVEVAVHEVTVSTSDPAVGVSTPPQTVTEQAFSLVSGLIKDRVRPTTEAPAAAPRADVGEQLVQLASLRDAGVLTEDEFTAKKAELLARM